MGSIVNCGDTCTKREIVLDMEVFESFNLASVFEEIIIKKESINPETKENIEAFLNAFQLKPGELRNITDFFRKQNLSQGKVNSGESKNVLSEDFYFKPESRNIKYLDKSIKRNRFITENDIQYLSSFKFFKFSDIFNYNFKDDIFKFELNKDKVEFSVFANVNLYNAIEQLLSLSNRLKNNILVYKEMKCFYVKLFLQGKAKWVLVDEHFPVHGDSSRPGFLQPSREFSWLLLIEKAYAKINRSYANCLRDLGSELFSLLTEAPLKSYNHLLISSNEIWKNIISALKKGLIIFSELDSFSLEQLNKEYFLSYFIVGAYTLKSKCYLKLAINNCNNDALFQKILNTFQNPYVPQELLTNSKIFPSKERDVFLVDYDFFYKIYAKTFFLFYQENYTYNYKKFLVKDKKYNMVKLVLKNNSNLFLTMHMKQSRNYVAMSNYEVPLSRMILCRRIKPSKLARSSSLNYKDNSGIKDKKKDICEGLDFIDSSFGKEEKHILELSLPSGEYYIIFKVFVDFPMHIVLTTYSDHFAEIEDVFTEDERYTFFDKNFSTYLALNRVFESYIGQYYEIEEKLKDDYIIKKSLHNSNLGYSIVKITNSSSNVLLSVSIGYEVTGMQIVSHDQLKRNARLMSESTNMNSRNTNEYITINPGKDELFIFEWEKTCYEVSINIYSKISLECHYYFPHHYDDFSQFKRKNITKLVFYYEIPFKNGIYIIFFNRSNKKYTLAVEFSNTNNILVESNKGNNIIELILNRFTKEYIHLKLVSNEEVKYKIDLNLQEI